MYRTSVIAFITLGASALSFQTSLAFDYGGGNAGRFGPTMASVVAPVASHLPPEPSGGAATPR
jgi:hypothetical protein